LRIYPPTNSNAKSRWWIEYKEVIYYHLHSSNTFPIVSSLRVTSTEIMTTTSMSCELAVIQYPHLESTAKRRILHLQSRQWHVSKIHSMNYHRVEFHVCKCMGSASLLEYESAQDFVEFDRISNVKMKSVVDFRTECKILKEPNLEMPISSDDNGGPITMQLQGYTIPTPTNRRAPSDFNFEPPPKSAFFDQDPLPLMRKVII
jgi:hypothetical protein